MRITPTSRSAPHTPLPRAVWVLSWVSFFADISGEMISPLLPLFLVGVLGASLTQIGLIEGSTVLIIALMTAVAGFRSDKHGRRVPWIRWGYGLPVLGKTVVALANIWPLVLAGRLLDRFGKGLRSAPRDALIADVVDATQRGRAFGVHRAIDTAGALVGVLLSAALLWLLTGNTGESGSLQHSATNTPEWVYRVVFGIAALLGLASFALTFLVKESSEPPPEPEIASEPRTSVTADLTDYSAAIGWFNLPRSYWSTLLVLILFSLANSSDAFLLLRANDLGYSPWVIVLMYALFNVTYAFFAYPAGVISDRVGRFGVIAVGWLIYLVVYLGFAYLPVTHAWGIWPLMGVYGVYMALTDGVGKALIADQSPHNTRGTALGLFYALSGLSTLIASLLAGILWDRSGPTAAFLLSAGFALLALIALCTFRSTLRTIKQTT